MRGWGGIGVFVALCIIGVSAEFAAAACPSEAFVRPYPRLPQIDRIAERLVAQAPLAGLSVAVMHRSKLVHAAGYGYSNLELGTRATPDTVYRIGSVTKQFTAAAILQSAEKGALSLDEDVRKFLPDFDTGGRVVTIRQLLNHTSGIRNITEIPEAMAPRSLDVTREQVFAWLGRAPFDFEPGERYLYNNSGYWLLGTVIERLGKQPYGAEIQRRVLQPICLTSTRYDVPAEVVPLRASGYARIDGQFQNAEPNSPTRPYASGALLSTALDLVRWQRELFAGRVVSADSLRLMTTRGLLKSGEMFPYGFGVGITMFQGHRKVAHPGAIIGFSSFVSYYPEHELAIAVLTNTMGVQLRSELEEHIARRLLPGGNSPGNP